MVGLLQQGVLRRRCLVVLAAASLGVVTAWSAQAGEAKWGSHTEVTIKAGTERKLGKLNLFAPFAQDEDSLWFMDGKLVVGRGDGAGSSSVEGNLGLGFRRIQRGTAREGDDYIWGVYGFFDHMRTENQNDFNQATLGAELFTNKWDFRINGYLPERDSKTVGSGSSSAVVISGTGISALTTGYEAKERALPGMDIEAGYSFHLSDGHRLNAHLGYFHFDRDDSPTIEGPRARAEYVIYDLFQAKGSRLSLGLEAQADAVRDDQYFVSATIRFPLGKAPKSVKRHAAIDRRMTESVVRDIDIVTFAQDIGAPVGAVDAPEVVSQQTSAVTNTLTGNTVSRIIYASSTGSGSGTEADPAGLSTADAVAKAGSDGVIVVLDSTNIGGSSITLQEGQTLVGAGGTLTLESGGGSTVTRTFSGSTPTITNTAGSGATAIVAGSGSTINSLNLSGAGVGVDVNARNNVALAGLNIDVTNPGGTSRGVFIHGGSSNVTLNNVNVNSALGGNNTGIAIDGSSDVTMAGGSVRNVVSSAASSYGVLVYASTNTVFDGVSVDAIAGATDSLGIASAGAGNNVTLRNVDISGISTAGSGRTVGYYVSSSGGTSIINDTNFHDYSAIGIYTADNVMTVDGSGNTASGIATLYQNSGATVSGQINFDSPPAVVP